MVDVARVNLFGRTIGTFRWDERYDLAQFEYDRGFVGRGTLALSFRANKR